jgi:hypothetical protein
MKDPDLASLIHASSLLAFFLKDLWGGGGTRRKKPETVVTPRFPIKRSVESYLAVPARNNLSK